MSHPSLCGHKGLQRKRNKREWWLKCFLVGENDSEVWRQQLLRSACTVALNTPHSQTRLVMQHLAPSLTCRTRKFPQVFTTWRERKQVILHQMNLNAWLCIQGFSKKKNNNKYRKKLKERYEYVKLYFTGTFQDKKTTPFKYHPHQEQTCLSSVCTYIYICMPHCRFFFSFRSQRRRKLQESLRRFTRGEKAQSSRYSPSSVHSLILGCVHL